MQKRTFVVNIFYANGGVHMQDHTRCRVKIQCHPSVTRSSLASFASNMDLRKKCVTVEGASILSKFG